MTTPPCCPLPVLPKVSLEQVPSQAHQASLGLYPRCPEQGILGLNMRHLGNTVSVCGLLTQCESNYPQAGWLLGSCSIPQGILSS